MARHSLKGRTVIRSLLKTGKSRRRGHLILYHGCPPEYRSDYAGAFLIGRRAGNAVRRNRIKRWIREDFRLLQKDRPKFGAFVIRFMGEADEVGHKELTEDLRELYETV